MTSAVVQFSSRLDRESIQDALTAVHDAVQQGQETVVLDLSLVDEFDSAGMAVVLQALKKARAARLEVRLKGLSEPMLDFFSLVSVERLAKPVPLPAPEDPVSRVGGFVEPLLRSVGNIGSTAVATASSLLRRPAGGRGGRLRWDRVALELEACAFGALPIICLIGFLLGLILAMQAFVQLQMWSAEIYMANMVGVSVLYEIGPLMTAIVLAARSGSSNAAQIGSMVVSEEVDALRQMGLQPIRYLVAPKVLALGVAALGLCVVFDFVALIGGAVFAYAFADIDVHAYATQTRSALSLGSFLLASVKVVVFGLCTGVVGCGLGLRVEGGSEGVGRSTTNAVVLSIFLIILIDALFVSVQQLWPS